MCSRNLNSMGYRQVFFILIVFFAGCGQNEKDQTIQYQVKSQASSKYKSIESLPESDKYKRRAYHAKLQEAHSRFKRLGFLDTADVAFLMPRDDQEFGAFYALSHPGIISSGFYVALDSSFLQLACNKENLLLAYLNMSTLVDGEYAESYYENVSFMFDKIGERICQLEPYLKEEAKMMLQEYFAENCTVEAPKTNATYP